MVSWKDSKAGTYNDPQRHTRKGIHLQSQNVSLFNSTIPRRMDNRNLTVEHTVWAGALRALAEDMVQPAIANLLHHTVCLKPRTQVVEIDLVHLLVLVET
jgi:hypothetical protein